MQSDLNKEKVNLTRAEARVELDEVDIWYISRDKPGKSWLDMPGVPA